MHQLKFTTGFKKTASKKDSSDSEKRFKTRLLGGLAGLGAGAPLGYFAAEGFKRNPLAGALIGGVIGKGLGGIAAERFIHGPVPHKYRKEIKK